MKNAIMRQHMTSAGLHFPHVMELAMCGVRVMARNHAVYFSSLTPELAWLAGLVVTPPELADYWIGTQTYKERIYMVFYITIWVRLLQKTVKTSETNPCYPCPAMVTVTSQGTPAVQGWCGLCTQVQLFVSSRGRSVVDCGGDGHHPCSARPVCGSSSSAPDQVKGDL
jgi:hypothetical protein